MSSIKLNDKSYIEKELYHNYSTLDDTVTIYQSSFIVSHKMLQKVGEW